MKQKRLKSLFIEELSKIPIVQTVCVKLGVSRQTYYRWRTEDTVFARDTDEALLQGEETINDYAESNVLEGIQRKDPKYTMYWLAHRHPKYKKPTMLYREPLSSFDEEKEARETAEFLKRFALVEARKEKRKDDMEGEV